MYGNEGEAWIMIKALSMEGLNLDRVRCLSKGRSFAWNRIFVMNIWGAAVVWLVCL